MGGNATKSKEEDLTSKDESKYGRMKDEGNKNEIKSLVVMNPSFNQSNYNVTTLNPQITNNSQSFTLPNKKSSTTKPDMVQEAYNEAPAA